MEQNGRRQENRWFSDGPSMAYPNRDRTVFWLVELILYILLNMFVLRIQHGTWLQLEGSYPAGGLIEQLLWPLNIFQFPSEIIVVALTMALLCAVPILTAQLYSLLPSIPFALVVLFLGHNPLLSLCLFVSCAVASFEPLRFKSKFVAALMCLIPEVAYWSFCGGDNPEQDVLRWIVLYAPWAMAGLACVAVFGIVLTIGHFLRYRPGVLMPVFAAVLAGTVFLFDRTIGMHERDFRANVYRYSPAHMSQFQARSIKPILEDQLDVQRERTRYLTDDTILEYLLDQWLREFGAAAAGSAQHWGSFSGNTLSPARRSANEFGKACFDAIDHIDLFISQYPGGLREPDAIYYKALISDINVDYRALRDERVVQFYFDRPTVATNSQQLWRALLERFPETSVSVEARWRLALMLAGSEPRTPAPGDAETYGFNEAQELLVEAKRRCSVLIQELQQRRRESDLEPGPLAAIFTSPPETMSLAELRNLLLRIDRLASLIDKENRTGHPEQDRRLARFVRLDERRLDYKQQLTVLTLDSPKPDPLIDNIELAQAQLERDPDQRVVLLSELAQRYPDKDGGVGAMLALARVLLDQRHQTDRSVDRRELLIRSREQLQRIITLRPESFWADAARELLRSNPLE